MSTEAALKEPMRMYEYSSAANPSISGVPVLTHEAELHQSGPTRVIPFDASASLGTKYAASSPNLLVSFLRIKAGESLRTSACATSQAFYVIRGSSKFESEHTSTNISYGDLIVIPASSKECVHTSSADEDTAIFWVSDEPLMKFLGVTPNTLRFRPTKFERKDMLDKIEEVKHEPGAEHRNRLGILLGNESTDDSTLTLTHVLWSLLNVLPAGVNQRPHRHNSVALDLAVYAKSTGGVYTLMGPELDADGWVKNPIRRDWGTGGCFITPPGWWHSHHNESDEDAMVLPIQDAGLYTYQRALDIQFSKAPDTVSVTRERRLGSHVVECGPECTAKDLIPEYTSANNGDFAQ